VRALMKAVVRLIARRVAGELHGKGARRPWLWRHGEARRDIVGVKG
jgi:hypothetical protein